MRLKGKNGFMSGDSAISSVLMVATVLLACLAPLMTLLPRVADAPPYAYRIFLRLFLFNDYAGSLAMLVALVFVLLVPKLRTVVLRMVDWIAEHPLHVVGLAFVLFAAGARFIYMAHPFSMDEYTPRLQAHALATGQLAAHYPPDLLDRIVLPAFQNYFIFVDRTTGEAISGYWPGLALLLTPFVWLGLDWCLNPVLSALALFMIYKLASDVAGSRTAGSWAMLLALASPQFTINAMSWYAMPGELALNLLFLWLLLRPGWKSALVAGLVGGLALLMHNPVPHAVVALPCLLWLACNRERWSRLLAVLVGYAPLGLGLGIWWWVFKSGFVDPQAALPLAEHQGVVAGALAALSKALSLPTGDLLKARWYAAWKMWIWACPGLLLVLLVPRRLAIAEKLLVWGFVLTFVFYLFVIFDQGHGWGYRYIHPAWGALPILSGVLLATGSDAVRRWGCASVVAGLLATPVFLWQTHATIADALAYRPEPPNDGGNWVIFVRMSPGQYRGDLVQNLPGQTNRLYLIGEGKKRDRDMMASRFPGALEVLRTDTGSVWQLPPAHVREQTP